MKAVAIMRAEELDRGYGAAGGVDEGILRVKHAAETRQIPEAQTWLSAIFILVRRLRLSTAA